MRFKEEKGNSIYYPELDGLRFFAFLLVFIHHNSVLVSIPYLSVFKTHGWIGVDLFFSLSAFLFTKLLLAEYNQTKTIDFKKFYLRRIFRIWPLYFMYMALCIYLYMVVDQGLMVKKIILRLISLCTFSDNLVASVRGLNPIPYMIHLWTISYEEQFYVFVPFIILLFARLSVKLRIMAVASVFILFNLVKCLLIYLKLPHPAIYVLPFTHFESIIFGIIIGFGGMDFLLKKFSPRSLIGFAIGAFLLFVQLPDISITSYWLILTYLLAGLSTAMVLLAIMNSQKLKNAFSKRWLVFLGKRSFGLYLFHLWGNEFSLSCIKHFWMLPSGRLAAFFYSLAFTVVIAVLSYRFIETPFLYLKKRFEVIGSRPITDEALPEVSPVRQRSDGLPAVA